MTPPTRPITVADLIRYLQAFPPEAVILVDRHSDYVEVRPPEVLEGYKHHPTDCYVQGDRDRADPAERAAAIRTGHLRSYVYIGASRGD